MELAKKKKKSMKEQPFKPEVDTGIEKPVRGMLAVAAYPSKHEKTDKKYCSKSGV